MSEGPERKPEGRRKRRGGLRVPSDTVPRKDAKSPEENPGNFADAVSVSFGAANGADDSVDQDEIATVVAEPNQEEAPTIAMDKRPDSEDDASATLVEMPTTEVMRAESEHEEEGEKGAEGTDEEQAVAEEISVLDSAEVRAISEDGDEGSNEAESMAAADSVDIPIDEDSDENTLTSEFPASEVRGRDTEEMASVAPTPAPDLTPRAPSVPDLPPVEEGKGKKKPRFTRAMTMALNESDLEEVRAEVSAVTSAAEEGAKPQESTSGPTPDGGNGDAAAEPAKPPATPAAAKANTKAGGAKAGKVVPMPPKPAPKAAAKEKKRGKPWFDEIFDENYLRTLPFLTPQATKFEANFVMESLGVEAGAQVLDIGCGYGRHAMELAARGYNVVGLDSSMPLLLRGAEEAQRRNLNINFVHGDMRELDYESQFDGAYCLFSSFGYFDDETNKKTAQNICRSLKPGARFVVEVLNRDYLVADLPSRVWWEGDGCVVLEEVEFNYFSSRIISNRSVVFDDGRQLEQEISLRSFSLHELGKFLHSVGFRVLEISGSMSTRGRFFGPHSRDIVVVAERRPDEPGSTRAVTSGN